MERVFLIRVVCRYVFEKHGEGEIVAAVEDWAFGGRCWAPNMNGFGGLDLRQAVEACAKVFYLIGIEPFFEPKEYSVNEHNVCLLALEDVRDDCTELGVVTGHG